MKKWLGHQISKKGTSELQKGKRTAKNPCPNVFFSFSDCNTSTHIVPTLAYLEKDPVFIVKFSFPFTCGYFLSATILEP